mgnify:CR=1 FL=1
MIQKEQLEIIQQVVREFLAKLGVGEDIKIESKQDGEVSVDVLLQEPQLLIGERGQTMFEIQHILKALLRKKIGEPVQLVFDINDYQKNKEQYLRELARTAADEVALLKKDKELPAMTPGERRIVHMELAERQDVVSESVGEEPERRVVIKVKAGGS